MESSLFLAAMGEETQVSLSISRLFIRQFERRTEAEFLDCRKHFQHSPNHLVSETRARHEAL